MLICTSEMGGRAGSMKDITEMSITEAARSGLSPIDFGYKRIQRIDDSYMFFGFAAWSVFIHNPSALTVRQRERLISDGVKLCA